MVTSMHESLVHRVAEVQRTPEAVKQDCIDRWKYAAGKEAEQRANKLAAFLDYLDADAPSQRPPRTDYAAWSAWCVMHRGVFEAACVAFGVPCPSVHKVYKIVTGYQTPASEQRAQRHGPATALTSHTRSLAVQLKHLLMEQGEKALVDFVMKGCPRVQQPK